MACRDISAASMMAKDILDKVKHGLDPSDGFDECLKEVIVESLNKRTENLADMVRDQLKSGKHPEDIKAYVRHMDDYLTQCYRQRSIQMEENKENMESEDIHICAIQGLSGVLIGDLRLQGTTVLDNLVGQDVLSEAGRSSILARSTMHGKNRAFIKHCNSMSCSDFKRVVIPALKRSNDEVNAKLAGDLEEEMANPTKRLCVRQCSICKIQGRVNIRRLSDKLYELGALSDNLRDDLSSHSLSNTEKWDILVKKVKKSHILLAIKNVNPGLTLNSHCEMICSCKETTSTIVSDTPNMSTDNTSDIARLSDVTSEMSYSSDSHSPKSFISRLSSSSDLYHLLCKTSMVLNIIAKQSESFCLCDISDGINITAKMSESDSFQIISQEEF